MAVSVIDTRGEFKLVPYSGDDERWPQWVLKFEASSELVGWGRQLDAAAAASTLPIVNTPRLRQKFRRSLDNCTQSSW